MAGRESADDGWVRPEQMQSWGLNYAAYFRWSLLWFGRSGIPPPTCTFTLNLCDLKAFRNSQTIVLLCSRLLSREVVVLPGGMQVTPVASVLLWSNPNWIVQPFLTQVKKIGLKPSWSWINAIWHIAVLLLFSLVLSSESKKLKASETRFPECAYQ